MLYWETCRKKNPKKLISLEQIKCRAAQMQFCVVWHTQIRLILLTVEFNNLVKKVTNAHKIPRHQ